MSPPQPARIRYYVDADILGLAKLLIQIRTDLTYPGDPGGFGRDKRLRQPCPITEPRTPDDDWIPLVAAAGWIVITKDSGIGRTRRLRDLANEYDARLIAIAARGKMRTWGHLVVITSVWDRMDELLDVPGPWMYRATRGRLNRVRGIG